jgi:hypothetical protein
LAAALGNRGMSALIARARTSPGLTAEEILTSPPTVEKPDLAAIEEGHELTTPDGDGGLSDPGTGAGSRASYPVDSPDSLDVKGSGTIEGSYGISQYWPVTKYWGDDKTLGKFDEAATGGGGWRMIGHKFQVVGKFTSGSTTTSPGGTVMFKQEARITNTKGGTPGPWFDDMDYTDAGGGKHTWDPNTESGSTTKAGYPGVRRTVATGKYAYTDPPALTYKADTNTYRKLEFKIHLIPPPGASGAEIVKTATQEIEVVDGKPNVLQAP